MFAPQVAARGVPVAEFNMEDTPATKNFMCVFLVAQWDGCSAFFFFFWTSTNLRLAFMSWWQVSLPGPLWHHAAVCTSPPPNRRWIKAGCGHQLNTWTLFVNWRWLFKGSNCIGLHNYYSTMRGATVIIDFFCFAKHGGSLPIVWLQLWNLSLNKCTKMITWLTTIQNEGCVDPFEANACEISVGGSV